MNICCSYATWKTIYNKKWRMSVFCQLKGTDIVKLFLKPWLNLTLREIVKKGLKQAWTSSQRILTRGRIAGNFSLGQFNVAVDCFCRRSTGTLIDSMRGNRDVSFTGNGAQWLAEKSRRHPLQNCPLLGGSGPRLTRASLGPPKSTSWTASRSFYLLLLFCRDWLTDRQTRLLSLWQYAASS